MTMNKINITIPEGYEIDEKNSTFKCIKFKPVKKQEFEYVNLGLPSGTLWATCNVGAKKPEEYGKLLSYDSVVNKYELPTLGQIKELIEFCDWKYVNYNKVNGYLVIGTNGKSIFLPAAGYRNDTSLNYAGSVGYYWSRTLSTDYPINAWYLDFFSVNVYTYYYSRYNGLSVRPVFNTKI